MATNTDGSAALACVPGAIPLLERVAHFARARRLLADATDRQALSDGYAIRLPVDSLDDVARFIRNERLCCPFLQFDVSISAASDSLWLRMTGPEGTREVLEAELSLKEGCGCGQGQCT